MTPQKDKPPGAKRALVSSAEEASAGHEEDDLSEEEPDKDEREAQLILTLKKGVTPPTSPFEREKISMALAEAAAGAGIPPLDDDGTCIRNARRGPFYVHTTLSDARAVHEHAGTIAIVGPGPGKATYEFDTSVREDKALDPSMGLAGIAASGGRDFLDTSTVHVIAYLEPGKMFRTVKPYHLKACFRASGLLAIKAQQQYVKLEGEFIEIKALRTEQIHLNVMPTDGSIGEVAWPPFLKVQAKVKRSDEGKANFLIRYKICDHPELPNGVDPRKKEAGPASSADRSKRAKATHTDALNRLGSMMAKNYVDKADKQCPHFLAGRCWSVRRGVACGFKHEGGAPETILCAFGPGKPPYCRNGAMCGYLHVGRAGSGVAEDMPV